MRWLVRYGALSQTLVAARELDHCALACCVERDSLDRFAREGAFWGEV